MTQERWRKFSKSEQIGAIGAEIMRAQVWEGKDDGNFISALERAIQLVDSSLDDPQWEDERYLAWHLRDEIGKYYVGQSKNIKTLYAAI